MKSEKSNKERFKGIIPPIVTPLTSDEELDVPALHRLIDHCILGGVSGVFVNGTSGEALRLPEKIWEDVLFHTLEYAKNRIDVFCGAIDTSTTRVIEKLQIIEKHGGKIAVCTPPFYLTSFGQDEVIRHFNHICQSTTLSIALYNIPETTNVNIEVDTFKKLSTIENVIAIKDSSANWQHLQRLLMEFEDIDISIFNGAEELCASAMLFGAQGCIPGLANFFPSMFSSLELSCQRGDNNDAYIKQKQINQIRQSIFVNGCWVSGMKGLLELSKIGTRAVSTPLVPLTNDEIQQANTMLLHAEISFI